MRAWDIFIYEWKHLLRSPFKVVGILLFILASLYGLYNGKSLFDKQSSEISKLEAQMIEKNDELISYFDKGQSGPADKPWVDISDPSWTIWLSSSYYFKRPSPCMVYSIGQAEQFGFYKKISTYSSPYDTDMAEEIANPERTISGTLDFSFAILFLLPLLLLILFYNIKGAEIDNKFLSLIFVQTGSENWWLVSRITFYVVLLSVVILALMFCGAVFTNALADVDTFLKIYLFIIAYLFLWVVLFFTILKLGMSTVSNALAMVAVWLLLAFIIPASVQQWLIIQKPTNLMIDMIDVKRDTTNEIYEQEQEESIAQLFKIYPKLKNLKANQDPYAIAEAKRNSMEALTNHAMKKAARQVEEDNLEKNILIGNTYWFNPITFFQNQLNHFSQTHFNDYQDYRVDIQKTIDRRIEILLEDVWDSVIVDKQRFLEYQKEFTDK